MSTTSYVVITQHVVGSPSDYEVLYHCDGETFASRAAALRHGYRATESDDFNIGTLRDGRLVSFGWGDWDFGDPGHDRDEPHGGYDLAEIQRQALPGGAR